MKIGILGSGDVAKALAKGFLAQGHEVTLGTQHAEKLAEFVAAHPQAQVKDFAATAAEGELIVLALKGSIAQQLLAPLKHSLEGKVVIDTTNPIADAAPVKGVLQFFTGPNDSLGERLQAALPGARLVKAFNSVGSSFMVNPQFPGGKPSMFIAGNDAEAKRLVARIAESFGWELEDMGEIESSRALEPLCQLWCLPGFRENRWSHAFKLLK